MKFIKLFSMIAVVLMSGMAAAKSKSVVLTYGDGESLSPGDVLVFSVGEMPSEIKEMSVLEEFLPQEIKVRWTGSKFYPPKKGKVKYSKHDEDFVTTQKANPCGLSIKYKKGKITGSFSVYVAKSEKKVKAYKAKVSGTLGEELTVTVKNAAGSYSARME